MSTNTSIPSNICEAATTLLRPYIPNLTAEKLAVAVSFEPENKTERLMTRKEASSVLRVSTVTLDRMLRKNELSRVRVRGRVLVRQSEIDSILEGGTRSMAIP